MNETERAKDLAVREYGLPPSAVIEPVSTGRVNRTFRVTAGARAYALQKMHPVFGADGAVVENTASAARRLASAGLAAPTVMPAIDGRLWAEADGIWRLSAWLPGQAGKSRTRRAAAEAGRLLGVFHRVLADGPPPLIPLPPAEHNREDQVTPEDWESAMDRFRDRPEMTDLGIYLERGRDLAAALPRIEPATRAVVHGDPKFENFLFDPDGRASALIDLDTVRRGFLIWDLADALRSFAGIRNRNDRAKPDMDLFAEAAQAYRAAGPALTDREWTLLPEAVRAKSLRLAWRYLTDAFEQTYFAWDREKYPSLREQNRLRGAGLLDFVDDPGLSPSG